MPMLVRGLNRVYGQAQPLGATRSLDITARRNKKQWLELNADVATAFAVRYRGLPALMGDSVNWDTSHLFKYEALLESAQKSKKYRRNLSESSTILQIKFEITLTATRGTHHQHAVGTSRPDLGRDGGLHATATSTGSEP
jgi:DNA segregation ATPase FtsK/SpoIIIE, S-DNA-T family